MDYMSEVKGEVLNAIDKLKYTDKDILILDSETVKKIYNDCLDYFVKSGDRRWWWEDFKYDSFDFITYDKPFEQLVDLIPDLTKNVWFMIEDNSEDYYPIYDCNPKIIGQIIGECFGFEYYIIDKDKGWLICENHHNRLIGVGETLKMKNIDRIK